MLRKFKADPIDIGFFRSLRNQQKDRAFRSVEKQKVVINSNFYRLGSIQCLLGSAG